MKSKARCHLFLCLLFSITLLSGCKTTKDGWIPGTSEQKDGAGNPAYSIRYPLTEDQTGVCVASNLDGTTIAVANLENNRVDYIRVDHTTGEVTRWTAENVPLGDIYNLLTESK